MRTTLLFILVGCQVTTTDNFANPPPGPPETCAVIANLAGCDQGSVSYACKGDRPDDGDPDLVCSNGTPGAPGMTLYCCAPYAQQSSDCTTDTTIAGCGGIAIGFRCTGGDDPSTTPSDADPTIACSAAMTADGAKQFCCNTAAPVATCALDPAVACLGIEVGYTCTGTDVPLPTGFACAAQPASVPGETSYCCAPS